MMNYSGHHAEINFKLARELRRRGYSVTIFANKKFVAKQADADVRPHFTHNPYDHLENMGEALPNNQPFNVFEGLSRTFLLELRAIEAVDMSLLTSMFAYQLHAIADDGLEMGRIVGLIHNQPDFHNPDGATYWRQAFIKSRLKHAELRLGILEPELLLEYESLLPGNSLEIEEFPIPHDGSDAGALGDQLLTVGLLGHQRADKGLNRLSSVVSSSVKLGFNVTVQDSAGLLQAKVGSSGAVRYAAYVEDFGALIRECNVTLLDYSAEVYRFSGSGIAWESIASGVPVIGPKGSTISRLLRRYDTGATFSPSDPMSKFKVLEDMRANYSSYLYKAALARQKYKEVNGTERFVNLITKGLAV